MTEPPDDATPAETQAIQTLSAYLEAHQDELFALTQALVRIPSVNPKFVTDPPQNREADVQELLRTRLDGLGLRTELSEPLPGRPNLRATLDGTEARSLILNGHIDVVPVDSARWTVDPFGGEIVNGRLYGRGSVDMKAGVAANVMVVHALQASGLRLEGRLELHSVVDEEAGGFGTQDLIRCGHTAAAAIVTEPTWNDVMPAAGGLYWLRVTIRGRQAHSGWRFNEIYPQPDTPGRLEPGVNAIDLAARFLSALRFYELDRGRARSHPLLPPGVNGINVGVIRGGAGLDEAGLPLIMTNPAIIPDVVTLDIDLKFLPQEDAGEVRADFERFVTHFCAADAWLRGHPIQVEWALGGLYFPPMNTPADHPLVRHIQSYRASRQLPTRLRGFEAVADAAFYAGAGMPVIMYGPSGDGFHGEDESVDLASLLLTAQVVAASVVRWCGLLN